MSPKVHFDPGAEGLERRGEYSGLGAERPGMEARRPKNYGITDYGGL